VKIKYAIDRYSMEVKRQLDVLGTINSSPATNMPRGGHFAAMEQPEALAAEMREFFRPLRRE